MDAAEDAGAGQPPSVSGAPAAESTVRALQQERRRLSVLSEAGARLARSLQPSEVLDVLAQVVVPRLAVSIALAVTDPVAELLGITAGNEPDRLHVVHVRHRDAALQGELERVVAGLRLSTTEASGVGMAVRTGRHQSYPRVPDEFMRARARDEAHYRRMQALNGGPQLTVPLVAPTGVLGGFTVASTDDVPLDDVLVIELAGRAAVALDNALSYARQHRAATSLQRALLPRTAPAVPGVDVATRYLPASRYALAGGDFFKTVRVGSTLVCALGDVMGHGTESAARAGQLHGLVAALALQGLDPAELLTQLAAGIDQMMDLELATLLVCCYAPSSRTLVSASAGHPPPLLAPADGPASYVDVVPGPPIGVTAHAYDAHACRLPRGAATVLFSDGLVERRGESISAGLERLRAAATGTALPPERLADHVLRQLDAEHADDDVALLVLQHDAQ